ncbi:MAG: hypothetical protein QM526_01115 [Alphaproteobacteria bacterium]|nr:hypothetical protein [Alphaproteobacteria bacterium]
MSALKIIIVIIILAAIGYFGYVQGWFGGSSSNEDSMAMQDKAMEDKAMEKDN